MTLRRRTLLLVATLLVLLIASFYGLARTLVTESFARLEDKQVRENVQRVLNLLQDELAHLNATTADYAGRDGRLQFVSSAGEAFFPASFTADTFQKLRLNLVLCLAADGRVLYAKGYNLVSRREEKVADLLRQGGDQRTHLALHQGDRHRTSGLALLPEGPMLVALRPITSDRDRRAFRGTLVMGRYLDDAVLRRLSEGSRLACTVERVNEARMPADFLEAFAASKGGKEIAIHPLSGDLIAGYALIPDILGQEALMLRVEMPRDIYRQGEAALLYLVLSLSLIGLLFIGAILLMVEKLVLARLARLAQDLRAIGSRGDLLGQVATTGTDELAILAAIIDDLLREQGRAQAALLESEERYRRIFEEALTGNYVVAADGTITLCNQAFAAIMGFASVNEAVGRNITSLYPSKEIRDDFYRLLQEKQRLMFHEIELVRTDGAQITVLENVIGVFSGDGELVQLQGYLLDITERKRAENEIRKLNESLVNQTVELISTNQEMEAFSYSISHDLRAPLTRINGFSQILLEDCSAQLTEDGRHYLDRIITSCRQLSQLIESLLDLCRISRYQLKSEAVDLSGMARTIASELRLAQPERDVEFKIADGLTGYGDVRLLRSVLENLIGNAWKYTRHQSQSVIEVGMNGFGGQQIFWIRDNGAGFDMKYADKLFMPFQRLHDAHDYEGNGIGLATVQRIIARHDGRIWADGAVGRGACFYFTLGDTSPSQLPVKAKAC